MTRITYDAEGKHFCDHDTREIINRLAECEIMLGKIEQIVAKWKENTWTDNVSYDSMTQISEVLEDGYVD